MMQNKVSNVNIQKTQNIQNWNYVILDLGVAPTIQAME